MHSIPKECHENLVRNSPLSYPSLEVKSVEEDIYLSKDGVDSAKS